MGLHCVFCPTIVRDNSALHTRDIQFGVLFLMKLSQDYFLLHHNRAPDRKL